MEGMVPFYPGLGRARELRRILMDQRAAETIMLSKETTDEQMVGAEKDYWRAQDDLERLNRERKSMSEGKEL